VSDLPPIPESIAGQFAGVHGERLIVAGGTYWTQPKWEGGEKRWTRAIYALGPGETEWQISGEQPEPLAYGAAVSTSAGVICIGGQGPDAASVKVQLLWWDGSAIRQRARAGPRMALVAALCGHSIIALGGRDSPAATGTSAKVWMLDAVDSDWERTRWQEAPSLPGPGRILPAIGAFDNSIFIASGAALAEDQPGKVKRTYLRDAFQFRQETGWTALPSLPAAVAGAPACCDAAGRFLIFGGDDGAQAAETGPRHPGFSRTILRLEKADWRAAGTRPEGAVTSAVISWQGSAVIPGGQNRPGTRTTRVLSIQASKEFFPLSSRLSTKTRTSLPRSSND
jgi:N-acetylneuraminic acid mutarotase